MFKYTNYSCSGGYLKKVFLLFLLCLLPFSLTFAWDATGHLIIGKIAYQHLTPETKQKADDLIQALDEYPPVGFVKATVWADWIKSRGMKQYNGWHYISKPYFDGISPSEINNKESDENLIWAIERAIKILKDPNASKQKKAFWLRMLIHLVGDAHQPMHCITRFTSAHPEGDRGGNLFYVKSQYADNLHHLWDKGVGLFSQKPRNFRKKAQKIERQYPLSYFGTKVEIMNPQAWCDESYVLATEVAYKTLEEKELTASYIEKGQEIVAKQTALAGYRLANLLNKILVNNEDETKQ